MSNIANNLTFKMHDNNSAVNRIGGNQEDFFKPDEFEHPGEPIYQPPTNTVGSESSSSSNNGGTAPSVDPGSPGGNAGKVTVPGPAFSIAGFDFSSLTSYFKTHPKIAYPVAALSVASIAYTIIKATKQ